MQDDSVKNFERFLGQTAEKRISAKKQSDFKHNSTIDLLTFSKIHFSKRKTTGAECFSSKFDWNQRCANLLHFEENRKIGTKSGLSIEFVDLWTQY